MFFFQRRTVVLYYVGVFVMWLSVTLVYPTTDSQANNNGVDTVGSDKNKCDDLMMGQYPLAFYFLVPIIYKLKHH